MLPWGHLAVGYLVYSVAHRVGVGRPPDGLPALVLVVGTQLPDLIDKPANWWFGFLDGRGAAHSLLVVVPLCALVVLYARRHEREPPGVALGVGVLTHVLGDAWTGLRAGQMETVLGFLFWPVLPAPTYPKDSLGDHLGAWAAVFDGLSWNSAFEVLSSGLVLEFAFALCVALLWAADEYPGVRLLWQRLTHPVRSVT